MALSGVYMDEGIKEKHKGIEGVDCSTVSVLVYLGTKRKNTLKTTSPSVKVKLIISVSHHLKFKLNSQ